MTDKERIEQLEKEITLLKEIVRLRELLAVPCIPQNVPYVIPGSAAPVPFWNEPLVTCSSNGEVLWTYLDGRT